MNEEKELIDGGAEKAAADMNEGRGEGRGRNRRRRKVSYLTINKIDYVDYKDVAVLRRFLGRDQAKVGIVRLRIEVHGGDESAVVVEERDVDRGSGHLYGSA